MYALIFKVRELLILCYIVLMFINLFIDWGKPFKLPVGSGTFSLPLVTTVVFCKVLEFL